MKTESKIAIILLIIILLGIIVYQHNSISKNTTQTPVSTSTSQTSSSTPVTSKNAPQEIKYVVKKINETSSSSPQISAEYPEFPALPEQFNVTVSSASLNRIADFKREVSENNQARQDTARPGDLLPPISSYTFISKWMPAQTNDHIVSFIVRFDSYTGGANEDQELQTFNYDVKKAQLLSLSDLFPNKPNYLSELSLISRKLLKASMDKASGGNTPVEMLNAGTEPTVENFKNFTFTDKNVTIYFPKYQVGPGAFGEQHVTIPISSVK